jgi:hypothetical protein
MSLHATAFITLSDSYHGTSHLLKKWTHKSSFVPFESRHVKSFIIALKYAGSGLPSNKGFHNLKIRSKKR